MQAGAAASGNSNKENKPKAAPSRPLQSVSIKSFTSGNGGKKETHGSEKSGEEESSGNEDIDPSWDNTFTADQLQKAWNDYARRVEKTNPRLLSMLTARSPRLKGSHVVVFPLQNETQEVELLKEKGPLFNYLRRELRNAKLQLEIEYIREDRGTKKAYTAVDKYNVLVEKNPALNKLKDALNLDLE